MNMTKTNFKIGDKVKITSDRIMAGQTKASFLKTSGLEIGMVARVRCLLGREIGLQIDNTHGAFVRDTMLTKL
jgi:hypothetical protein